MDVTRQNFREVYDIVEESISDATFVAIDGEFSGVTNSSFNITNYDSPEERYHKVRHNMSDFLLMQFGLVTFKWDAETERYISEAFNFYIFPFRSNISGVPDRIFSCQSSSIDFLTSQRFDFNKVFHLGIPYLRQEEEVALSNSLTEKHMMRIHNFKSPRKSMDNHIHDLKSPAASPTAITDPKVQTFLDGVKEKIGEFLKNSAEDDVLELEPCNSYFRKVLYETVPTMFPEPLMLESRMHEQTKRRFLAVSRLGSEESRIQKHNKAKARDDSSLLDAIGFSRVIHLLKKSGKLIVGHNMLLDLLFTLQQFIQPLPVALDELKALVSSTFPVIVDTKLMGSTLPFRELIPITALGELHNRLGEKPFAFPTIVPPEKYESANSNQTLDVNLHEAAYDAYITGRSFLAMLNFLVSLKPKGVKCDAFSNVTSEIISPYLNKVFLMRSTDIPYLNMSGSDLSPSRSHVFHVEFPIVWKAADIRVLFSPVSNSIYISWINDTQCFVALPDKNQAKQVKKILIKPGGMESSLYVIRTYEEYQRDVAGQVFSTSMWKPDYNITPYSKNKIWRPPTTANSSHAMQTKASSSNSVNNTDTPKSTVTNRKRSGEDASIAKPSSVRRISSTSNRIGSLDLGEPDLKRRVVDFSNDSSSSGIPVSHSSAKTDIPILVSSETKDEVGSTSANSTAVEMFEIPDWNE